MVTDSLVLAGLSRAGERVTHLRHLPSDGDQLVISRSAQLVSALAAEKAEDLPVTIIDS